MHASSPRNEWMLARLRVYQMPGLAEAVDFPHGLRPFQLGMARGGGTRPVSPAVDLRPPLLHEGRRPLPVVLALERADLQAADVGLPGHPPVLHDRLDDQLGPLDRERGIV